MIKHGMNSNLQFAYVYSSFAFFSVIFAWFLSGFIFVNVNDTIQCIWISWNSSHISIPKNKDDTTHTHTFARTPTHHLERSEESHCIYSLWQRSFTIPKSLWNSANKHTSNWQAFVLPLCYRQYLQSCFVCAIVDALYALVVLFFSLIMSISFSFSLHTVFALNVQPLVFMLCRFDIFATYTQTERY